MRKKTDYSQQRFACLKEVVCSRTERFSSLTLGHMGIPNVRRFKIAGFSIPRPYDHSDLYTDIAGFLMF